MIGIGAMGEEPVQALWFPAGTPNTLNTTAPAMAPGYNDGTSLPIVRALARVSNLSAAELAALQGDQSRICQAAADAFARNSPSKDGLARQCFALRAANFAKGAFVTQTVPVDPHYRVQLTEAGQAIVSANPSLSSARAALPAAQQRGFTMGVAVARGSADATYLTFLRAGLSPDDQAGLAAALRSSGGTRAGSPDDVAGLPRTAVIAGAAVVGLGIVGAIVYKMRRR